MTTATLGEFIDRSEARQADTAAAVRALIEAAATGKAFDEMAAETTLRAAGMTHDDFRRACERYRFRVATIATMRDGEAARVEATQAQKRIAELIAERDAKIQAIEAEYVPLIWAEKGRQQDAEQRQRTGTDARRTLVETAPAELRARLQRLNGRTFDGPIREAQDNRDRAVIALRDARQTGPAALVERMAARVERAEAALADARAPETRCREEADRLSAALLSPWPEDAA